MNGKEIVDAAIAKVVSPLEASDMANLNREFVLAMANEGYHVIERATLWKFSEAEATVNYTAGSHILGGLPNDFVVPLLLQRPDGQTLFYWDDRQEAYRPDEVGRVQFYSAWANDLKVWPKPNESGELKLRYYRSWDDLADTLDSFPIIPPTWHDLIHEYAAGKLAHRLPTKGERFLTFSRAEPFLESFHGRLTEMLQSDLVLKTFDEVPNHAYYSSVMDPENY